MPLCYHPLNPGKSEIRLLRLAPGNKNNPIRCTLEVASLDAHPLFEALSYVWGDSSVTKPVTVENGRFDATENLHAALTQLRHASKTRVLWVDAICINQTDVWEKNSQLPLMTRIYSGATSVIAWLGPDGSNVGLAVSWVTRYRDKKRLGKTSAHWLKLDIKSVFSKSAQRQRLLDTAKALQGCLDVVANTYWNRMWTFQEFSLPTREPVCAWGETQFSMTHLLHHLGVNYATINLIYGSWKRAVANYEASPGVPSLHFAVPSWDEQLGLLLQKLESFMADLDQAASLPRSRMPPAMSESPLSTYILLTNGRRCKDPHDKIYALYGMVPAVQQAWPPDYNKSIDRVLLETTAYCVNDEGTLTHYNYLRPHRPETSKSESSSASYPSWVLDYTEIGTKKQTRHLYGSTLITDRLHQIEDVTIPPSTITADLSTLHLWAIRMGRCEAALVLGPDACRVLQDLLALFSSWKSSSLFGHSSWGLQEGDDQGFPGRTIKCLLRYCGFKDKETAALGSDRLLRTMEGLEKSWGSGVEVKNGTPQEELRLAVKCHDTLMEALPRLAGRKLFVVTNSTSDAVAPGVETACLGIGEGDVRTDDVVVVAPKMRAAVALAKSSPAAGPPGYRMVGTVYIDGIMKGDDPVQDDVIERLEGAEVEEFLVY